MIDRIREHNRESWNENVQAGNQWTIPVSSKIIELARRGNWAIILTPQKPVPANWFPDIKGLKILCLASGGGQQGPILAAAGADVTVLDNSPLQLKQDQFVAERDGLHLGTVEGDMRDLSVFTDQSFDLIVQPVANCFIPNVTPLWQESFRVLRHGGSLLTGMVNPVLYIFDQDQLDQGILNPAHPIPYSDLDSLSKEKLEMYKKQKISLEFGHSLEDLIGGQIEAGFIIKGFYEDFWEQDPISKFLPTFFATKAVKP